MSFIEQYMEGLSILQVTSTTFGRLVTALGVPRANSTIDRAQVSWNPKVKNSVFEMNPDYIDSLDSEEVAAVIAHETFHIIFRHLYDLENLYYTNKSALTKAQECYINDRITKELGVKLPADVMYGVELFNKDFSEFTTTKEAYDYIIANHPEEDVESETGEKSEAEGSAEHSCGGFKVSPEDAEALKDYLKKTVSDYFKKMDPSEVDKDLLEEFKELLDAETRYSISNNNGSERVQVHRKSNMKWDRLIQAINPRAKTAGKFTVRESWQRPPRRLASVYPEVILPSYVNDDVNPFGREKGLPTLVIALDLSSSIPRHLVEDLVTIVDSTPEKYVKALPVTWSDYVLPYDKEAKSVVSHGGTNINGLYDYVNSISKNMKSKPYVLVITDGECDFSSYGKDIEYIRNQWYWTAIQSGDKEQIFKTVGEFGKYIKKSHIFNLKDFTGLNH